MSNIRKKIFSTVLTFVMLFGMLSTCAFNTAEAQSSDLQPRKTYTFEEIKAISNIPVMNVTMKASDEYDDMKTVQDKHDMATFELVNTNGKGKDIFLETTVNDKGKTVYPLTLKGRGNSTWTMPTGKKPYNIKFEEKQNLLGMGKSKSWCLLSNWVDTSFIRNYMAYQLAVLMGLETPDCEVVAFCIDGQFEGVYLLTEKVGLNEYRTETAGDGYDVNGDGIVTDSIVEADIRGFENEEPGAFETDGGVIFVPKDPAATDMQQSEYDEIVKEINAMEQAVMNGENYEDYIDVDSWIDVYIINELAKNPDFGYGYQPCYSSAYLYLQEGGKVYAGPVWDFDIAYGRNDYKDISSESYRDTVEPTGYLTALTKYYRELLENADFEERVMQRWQEIRETVIPQWLGETFNNGCEASRLLAPYDFEVWEEYGARDIGGGRRPLDFEGETAYVKNFIEERIAWLDSQWIPAENAAECVLADAFPDEKFRAYVSENFDSDKNGVLSAEEIASVTKIDVSGKGIRDLTGIGYFTALIDLNCANNNLNSLDLRNNTALEILDCSGNSLLAELNVSKNAELTYLNCESDSIDNLSLSRNTKLTYLNCESNGVLALSLRRNTELSELICSGNHLTELDLSNHPALESLRCENNNLSALNLGGCAALTSLYCSGNALTELNVGGCNTLKTVYCDNNELSELDVGGRSALETLCCSNNSIAELNLGGCSALTQLYCSGNALTELSLGDCTALNVLYCNNNNLATLDCPAELDASSFIFNQSSSTYLKKPGAEWVVDLKGLVNAENIGKLSIMPGQNWRYDSKTGIAAYLGMGMPSTLTYVYHGDNLPVTGMDVTLSLTDNIVIMKKEQTVAYVNGKIKETTEYSGGVRAKAMSKPEGYVIPLRYIGEEFDLSVEYLNGQTRLTDGDGNYLVVVNGENQMTKYNRYGRAVKTYYVPVAPFIEQGITYVPLRAVSEAIGLGVRYVSSEETGHGSYVVISANQNINTATAFAQSEIEKAYALGL